jgi:thymidylate kinase
MGKDRVALIGLDGSGKSANIDLMKKDSRYSGYEFMWVRWKPTLLKPLYKLIGNKTSAKKSQTTAREEGSREQLRAEYDKKKALKKKIFRSPFVKKAWIFLATVDYFFQFYAKTLGLLVTGKNIIFDRYYLDLYVDQGINFGYTPEMVHKQIKRNQWLFPKMDRIVYIKVSPQVCYDRKDDIPNMDYLEKRYAIYEYIAQKDNWIVVDGTKPLEEVNSTIGRIVLGE